MPIPVANSFLSYSKGRCLRFLRCIEAVYGGELCIKEE